MGRKGVRERGSLSLLGNRQSDGEDWLRRGLLCREGS